MANGFIDCNDFNCSRTGSPDAVTHCANLPQENSLADCTDGVDNDGNGFIDCNDFNCSRTGSPEAVGAAARLKVLDGH